MKKRKLLTVDEVNELNAKIAEEWDAEDDELINKSTKSAKIAAAHKGRKLPEATRRKISSSRTNQKVDEETREKISRTLKGRQTSPVRKGHSLSEEHRSILLAANIGRAVSLETRDKIRASLTGKKATDAAKRKMSASRLGNTNRKGIKASPEERAKLVQVSSRRRPVSINGTVYLGIREAGRQLELTYSIVKTRVNSTKPEWKNWFIVGSQ